MLEIDLAIFATKEITQVDCLLETKEVAVVDLMLAIFCHYFDAFFGVMD